MVQIKYLVVTIHHRIPTVLEDQRQIDQCGTLTPQGMCQCVDIWTHHVNYAIANVFDRMIDVLVQLQQKKKGGPPGFPHFLLFYFTVHTENRAETETVIGDLKKGMMRMQGEQGDGEEEAEKKPKISWNQLNWPSSTFVL